MKICWHDWIFYWESQTLILVRICNKCDAKQRLIVMTKSWPRVWPFARWKSIEYEGDPLSKGKVHIYSAGATMPLEIYTDSACPVINPNPVILDSEGEINDHD